MRRRFAVAWLLLALAGGSCSLFRGAAPTRVSGWIVDWSDAALAGALGSLTLADGAVAEIDFFRFHLDPAGHVVASRPLGPAHEGIRRLAAARGIDQIATFVNDTVDGEETVRLKDPDRMHEILAHANTRARLVDELGSRIREEGFDGVDVDVESLHAVDREAFTAFVAELTRAFHDEGKRVVVTVHPQFGGERRDGPGAQDLAALGDVADEIRIMAYHVHYDGTPPGPSAPLGWVEKLIAHNRSLVPPEKLSLAVYVGGWRWEAGNARQLPFAEAMAVSRSPGAELGWSQQDAVPFVRGGASAPAVEVWFEDACSVLEKAKLARAYGLRGLSLWYLGNEDPALFPALRNGDCER